MFKQEISALAQSASIARPAGNTIEDYEIIIAAVGKSLVAG